MTAMTLDEAHAGGYDLVAAHSKRFVDYVRDLTPEELDAPDRTFPFHAGQQITIAGGWGNLLGELLAHGDDLARATGRPFGIPDEDLEILWRFTMPALQGWLSPAADEVAESWGLQLPFGGIVLVIDHGTIRCGPREPALAAHHDIEITDVAGFTLAFPYKRRPITDPYAARLASRFRDL
jgi:hypothetical protein